MARLIGPSEASREVKTIVTTSGSTRGLFKSKALRPATYYVDPDPTATPTPDMLTTLADIRNLAGVAYADSTVTIDAYSMLPEMQFPDGVDSLLVVVDNGPPWRVYAREDDRLDALGTRVTAVEAGGSGDALVLHKAGAETITGIKTFSAEPVVPTPTATTSPATKAYVDTGDFRPAGFVHSRVATDGTDQKAVLDAEIAALMAAGGGTLNLPAGTIRYDGNLVLPNDGATPPKQAPLRLQGQGCHWSGRGTAIVGGTVLDMRGTGTYGKILTTGLGILVLRDLTLRDTSGGNTPFVYTTNTTLMPANVGFFGSKTGAACDQDAFILGGTVAIEGQGDPTHGFQGYGTVIKDCFFSGIRRAVVGRVYSNGVVVRNNTVWATCGNTTGAAIEFDGGGSGALSIGSVTAENLIELVNYKYGVSLANAQRSSLVHNNFYDPGAYIQAAIRFESSATYNLVVEGYKPGTVAGVSDASVDAGGNVTNTRVASEQGVASVYPSPAKFIGDIATEIRNLKVTGGSGRMTIQPDAVGAASTRILQALRSAAEATNPGADIMYLRQDGEMVVRGVAAGNFTFRDDTGTGILTIGSNGKTWTYGNGGGAVTFDSGTNGSYVTFKGFGFKFTKHDNSLTMTLFPLNGTPEGNIAQPVGSIAARADGTAATGVVYVKESGAATNAGYAAVLTRTGLYVKEGSNARQGVATLVAGTVTVGNTSVTANSRIFLTTQSLGTVTAPKTVAVTARVAGTSFTITSADATDTSVIAYQICEPG